MARRMDCLERENVFLKWYSWFAWKMGKMCRIQWSILWINFFWDSLEIRCFLYWKNRQTSTNTPGRTISAEGIGVIADIPPVDPVAKERLELYDKRERSVTRGNLVRSWQERWHRGNHGRWTYKLIPNIKTRLERQHGEVDYFIAQVLPCNGCFRDFLYKRKWSPTARCIYCESIDDVEHTVFQCSK